MKKQKNRARFAGFNIFNAFCKFSKPRVGSPRNGADCAEKNEKRREYPRESERKSQKRVCKTASAGYPNSIARPIPRRRPASFGSPVSSTRVSRFPALCRFKRARYEKASDRLPSPSRRDGDLRRLQKRFWRLLHPHRFPRSDERGFRDRDELLGADFRRSRYDASDEREFDLRSVRAERLRSVRNRSRLRVRRVSGASLPGLVIASQTTVDAA